MIPALGLTGFLCASAHAESDAAALGAPSTVLVRGEVLFSSWPVSRDKLRVVAGGRVVDLREDGGFEVTIDRPTAIAAFIAQGNGKLSVGSGEILAPEDGKGPLRVVLASPTRDELEGPRSLRRSCQRSLDVLRDGERTGSSETYRVMIAGYTDICAWMASLTREQIIAWSR